MGERGQSPLLYLGSPYLDFLDIDVSVDGTHGGRLTNPSNQLTDGLSTEGHHIDSRVSLQKQSNQTAAQPYLNGQLIANGLVVTTNSSATAEQSEILK